MFLLLKLGCCSVCHTHALFGKNANVLWLDFDVQGCENLPCCWAGGSTASRANQAPWVVQYVVCFLLTVQTKHKVPLVFYLHMFQKI